MYIVTLGVNFSIEIIFTYMMCNKCMLNVCIGSSIVHKRDNKFVKNLQEGCFRGHKDKQHSHKSAERSNRLELFDL